MYSTVDALCIWLTLSFFSDKASTFPKRMLRTVILSVFLTVSVHPLLSLVMADSGEIFVHELPPEWHAWKEEHGKTYQSMNDEMRRHDVWKTNMEMIRRHNAEKEVHGYTLRMNHLGDLVRIIEPLKRNHG